MRYDYTNSKVDYSNLERISESIKDDYIPSQVEIGDFILVLVHS